jgi:hypothetical protein
MKKIRLVQGLQMESFHKKAVFKRIESINLHSITFVIVLELQDVGVPFRDKEWIFSKSFVPLWNTRLVQEI